MHAGIGNAPTPTTNLKAKFLLEVCVDNVASAVAAEAGGAGRIELCSSLVNGGLTPSVGLLKVIKMKLKIPIFVMIRPRPGDFVYTSDEIQVMEEDIRTFKAIGADGFVFGILKDDGAVDTANCSRLLSLAAPLPSTFHRAFDFVPDPVSALEQIINLRFHRILTSGQKASALEGIDLICSLVEIAGDRIKVMPGAGVTSLNVGRILSSGVDEVHGSCRKKIHSTNKTLQSDMQLGSALTSDEMSSYIVDQLEVEAIVSLLMK